MSLNRIIIAGGGTGGHIFPAIAVAKALQQMIPGIEILFVGAKGKMEMEKVPQAGYKIEGIDIAGFNRSNLFQNWKLPFQLIKSFIQVRSIFKSFRPEAVFGVGGYSTFPVLKFAQQKGIPTFLHEANSFAGKANLMLSKKADLVMAGTHGMEKFFSPKTLVYTGNPVRREIVESKVLREEAFEYFGLKSDKPTVLVMGGSLGARSINTAFDKHINQLIDKGIQVIWQTGKGNLAGISEHIKSRKEVCVTEFIAKMNYAYKAADIVVSRAGAIALAEITVCGKPSVLVPFPLAAEDHQTVNAQMLVNKGAAIMVKDSETDLQLVETVAALINDEQRREQFAAASAQLGVKNADQFIATLIVNKMKEKNA
ncbi:MAG: undecaprenyldiphospho-muramoylpentapeptide beta-N-acetylglucosaminyltransferase [Bacteroidota bacterium]|jgi:UDP-N-acetylglucosamine--N-acetylmuramyl-(pentapeptide) pyrophosphoryl-undecaprenol N-acetylglucosamine transferase